MYFQSPISSKVEVGLSLLDRRALSLSFAILLRALSPTTTFPSPGGLRLVEPTPQRGGGKGEGEHCCEATGFMQIPSPLAYFAEVATKAERERAGACPGLDPGVRGIK